MADYISSFKEGLAAAEAAKLAKKEIDEVFVEFDKEIKKVSEGKVSIIRKKLKKYEKETTTIQESVRFMVEPRPTINYWAIVAYNPTIPESPVKELAEWNQDRLGFPCRIGWGNIKHTCEDRQALENTLAELLRDPVVGELLYALMRLGPPSHTEDNVKQPDQP